MKVLLRQKGKRPGKSFSEGMNVLDLVRMIPDDACAEHWLAEERRPDGAACPYYGFTNTPSGAKPKTMSFPCREKKSCNRFGIRDGTMMEVSNLGSQVRAIAMLQLVTNPKSVPSKKLRDDLNITQRKE